MASNLFTTCVDHSADSYRSSAHQHSADKRERRHHNHIDEDTRMNLRKIVSAFSSGAIEREVLDCISKVRIGFYVFIYCILMKL